MSSLSAQDPSGCLHLVSTCQQKALCKVSLMSYKAFLNLKGIYKPSSLPLATLAQMDNEHVDLLKMILWSLSIKYLSQIFKEISFPNLPALLKLSSN